MIPLLRMETLKNHTLLGGTYLSHWRMQTFRRERGGGGRSSKTFDKGGGQGAVSKNVFSALWASVCSKDKGVVVVVVVVVVVGGGGLPWIRLCI